MTMERLSLELKTRIVSFLPLEDAKTSTRLNSDWQKAAELYTWRSVSLNYDHDHGVRNGGSRTVSWPKIPRRWKMLVRALESNTTRSHYLRHLSGPSHPAALNDISSILRSCRHQIESLVQTVTEESTIDRDFLNVFKYLNKPLSLKRLEAFCLWSWEDQVFHAVRQTPRLEQITLHMQADRGEDESPHISKPRPRRRGYKLKQLETINIEADEWVDGVIWLMGMTENLSNLSVKTISMDLNGHDEQFEDLFIILRTGTLQWLSVTGPAGGEIWQRSLTMNNAAFLPSLESLAVETQWGPAGVPSHPTLRYLALFSDPETSPVCFAATRPTRTVTGLIAPWLIDGVERLPLLKQLFPLEPQKWTCTDDRWWEDQSWGFKFRSYCDAKRQFYHCRARHDGSTRRLIGRHELSYNRGQLFWEEEDHVHLSTNHSSDNHITIEKGDWIHLTFYRGLPLPRSLLDYIYSLNKLELDWDEGERNLQLSHQTWELLDEWAHEAHMELLTAANPRRHVDDRVDKNSFGFGQTCPIAIKRNILSYVDLKTAQNLAILNRNWQEIAEIRIWRHVSLCKGAGIGSKGSADRADEIERRWRRLHHALLSRPARQPLVRSIAFPPGYTPELDVCAVFRRIAPYVEEIYNVAEMPACSDGPQISLCAAELFCRIGRFPSLKRLDVVLDDVWEHVMTKALAETPNLEQLVISVDKCSSMTDPIPHYTTLRLGNLRSVRINADRWFPGVEVLMKHAPNIEELILFGGDGSCRPTVTPQMLKTIISSTTLKGLVLDETRTRIFSRARRELGSEGFFPNLEVVVSELGMSELLSHPNIKHYSLLYQDPPLRSDRGSTKEIPSWMSRGFARCPSLTSIGLIKGKKGDGIVWDDFHTLYHIREHTNGSHTLYHVRQSTQTLDEISEAGQGDDIRIAVCDLAQYDNKPLSLDVLDDVYAMSGHDRFWEMGKRDLSLPEDAWKFLSLDDGDSMVVETDCAGID